VRQVTDADDTLLHDLNSEAKLDTEIVALALKYGDSNPTFDAIRDILTNEVSVAGSEGLSAAEADVAYQANEACQLITGASATPKGGSPVGHTNFTLGEAETGASCMDFAGWRRVGGSTSGLKGNLDQPESVSITVFPGYSGGDGWGSNPGLQVTFSFPYGLAAPPSNGDVVYVVQVAPTSADVGQAAKDLELIVRNDGDKTETPGWSAEATSVSKSVPVANSAIDVGPGGSGGTSVSAVFPFSSLEDLRQPFYWSASEDATDFGTLTENPSQPYDTSTLGLMSNNCPGPNGSSGSQRSVGTTLRFPTPKGAPPGRGTFANSRRLPTGLAASIETAMGQGWAPFSHFNVRLDSDPHDDSWGEVFVSSVVGSTPTSEPGQGVVHHIGKKWQVVTGLGMAWPCSEVPDQVITDLDLDTSAVSGCTSSGELAHPGVTVPKDASAAPESLGDAVEAQTLPANSPISLAVAVVYERADPADPSWVEYYVEPSPANTGNFPNGTGLAHKVGTTWKIVTAPAASADCSPDTSVPAAVLKALNVQAGGPCALASPSTTTTTASSGTTPSSTPSATGMQTLTGAEPPALLSALQAAIPSIPSNELAFTYELDPSDSTWVSWDVQGGAGYTEDVQPAVGFAHWTGSTWQVWGPDTEDAGCAGQGNLGPVPTAVLAAFGDSCGG
jgi:hypothetical protein